jgi:hypothetical protein
MPSLKHPGENHDPPNEKSLARDQGLKLLVVLGVILVSSTIILLSYYNLLGAALVYLSLACGILALTGVLFGSMIEAWFEDRKEQAARMECAQKLGDQSPLPMPRKKTNPKPEPRKPILDSLLKAPTKEI